MSSGMYSTLSGAVGIMRWLDVTCNNLANINNYGFKKEDVNFESLFKNRLQMGLGQGMNFNRISQTTTDFSQGNLIKTDRSLDLAIKGKGFFKVAGENGFYYTRNGSFELQPDGSLVNSSGHQLVGQNGPISLSSSSVRIDQDGRIWGDNGEEGQITIYDVVNLSALKKKGDNLWKLESQAQDNPIAEDNIRQGYLEESNLNPMKEMTNLIKCKRIFQAYQKNLEAYGKISEKVNQIGQLS